MARIGFIGLGVMGREMALNLAKAGHAVVGHDVVPGVAEGLAAQGITPAHDLAAAAEGAEFVILMLPDTPQVEEVLTAPGGLLGRLRPEQLVIDMSTISPVATRKMAEALAARGVAMLDAPVSGGVTGARDAKLSIMVGGEEAAFARARPVLEAMGSKVVHVGAIGNGQTVKLCNQLVCAINIQAMCEAIALARASGLDPAVAREVLMGGSANSWMLENLGPKVLEKDAGAGFRIDLKLKDLRLANDLAFQQGVPLPGTALVTSLYLEARAHGEGSNGNQALFRVYDRMTAQER
ncbi:NAD(P)-dependent oxidoreductase [Roseomonas sp. M0104]|uniref:NAD(P)-dependent oxidoreductase n=1 Tax=Teichococcus coralli TaxID=2545983 RepID=A0A845BD68_9PROT|nr:NAD(P)-dependent oxidoreductase [Pseudoroseomonas coralli]MXP65061.1 NAD(P)-dependent oxidoreductase [Pseudoroseomonas coralli]